MSTATADEYLVFGTLDDSPAPIAGNSQTGEELAIALVPVKPDLTHSSNIAPKDSGQGSAVILPFVDSGTLDNSPSPVPGDSQTGVQVPSYFDYFYERIHLIPNGVLNLGVVAGTRITDVTIWNAYTGLTVTVTDLPLTGSVNTTKSGEPATPFGMAPLTTTEFDLVTSAAATDFSFSTTLSVVESTAQGVSLTLTGLASLILALEPERPLETTLEWATNILTSSNGKEQRQALRSLPRESHALRYAPLTVAGKNLLRNQLMSHHDKAYGVPVWLEETPLTSAASATDTTIFLDTSFARFAVDEAVIVWTDENTYAVNQIDTVLADRLTLVRPLGADFTAGTMVIPMITGQIRQEVSGSVISPQFEHPEFRLTQTDNLAMPTYSPANTHNGEPLILIRPIANQAVQFSQAIDQRELDYGMGSFSRNPQWNDPKDRREHTFILRTKQERWEFRQFLFWLQGRAQTFYVPTFQDDLVQSQIISSSDTAIDVENHGYASLIYSNTERWRSLAFLRPDGTYITRDVTGSTNLSTTEDRVQIDSALGDNYNPGDLQISFLRHVRLASDRIEVRHEREDRTLVTLPLVTVDE